MLLSQLRGRRDGHNLGKPSLDFSPGVTRDDVSIRTLAAGFGYDLR